MKSLFILSFIFIGCIAHWTPPQFVSSKTNECTFPEMYMDPATRITHMLWIENDANIFKLAYAKLMPDRKTVTFTKYLETEHRARLSHIIGEGDGKHILLAYDAKRTQGDTLDCDEKETRGCYEIFFMESMDGGDTWTKPVQIKHDNVNDPLDRKGPRLTYIKDSQLTFITYWKSGPMAYAKRTGSGDFTSETILTSSAHTAYQSIVHTVDKNTKKAKLHFTYSDWVYPTEHLMYTFSVDNGATWSTPKELSIYIHKSTQDSFFRPFMAANSDILAGGIFITFILNNEPCLIWSATDGNTWSKIIQTHKTNAVAPRVQICRGPKNEQPRAHVLFGIRKPEGTKSFFFGTLNLQTSTYKEDEVPFDNMLFNWDYMVDCYVEDDKEIVGAIVETFVGDKNEILVSFNDAAKSTIISDAE